MATKIYFLSFGGQGGYLNAFCSRLLENYNVAITPGTDFGFNDADRHVRFSYAQNLEILQMGVD